MARLGRRQPNYWTVRVSPIVLAVQFTADLTGATTGSATVTGSRSDAGGSTGAATASATVTAATQFAVDIAGAVTASGTVTGVANIPPFRIWRAPFGRT